jgi:peptidoglycan/LPS O-acetylase OafA/YrhL
VSWFLSLILLCYALMVLAWLSRYIYVFWLLIGIACAVLFTLRFEVGLSRHVLAFAVGVLLSHPRAAPAYQPLSNKCFVALALPLIAFCLVGIYVDPQYAYAASSGLLLLIALRGLIPESPFINTLSIYSYAYFLVHGICLAVMLKLMSNAWLAIPMAILLAMVAAVLLERAQKPVAQLFSRVLGLPARAG